MIASHIRITTAVTVLLLTATACSSGGKDSLTTTAPMESASVTSAPAQTAAEPPTSAPATTAAATQETGGPPSAPPEERASFQVQARPETLPLVRMGAPAPHIAGLLLERFPVARSLTGEMTHTSDEGRSRFGQPLDIRLAVLEDGSVYIEYLLVFGYPSCEDHLGGVEARLTALETVLGPIPPDFDQCAISLVGVSFTGVYGMNAEETKLDVSAPVLIGYWDDSPASYLGELPARVALSLGSVELVEVAGAVDLGPPEIHSLTLDEGPYDDLYYVSGQTYARSGKMLLRLDASGRPIWSLLLPDGSFRVASMRDWLLTHPASEGFGSTELGQFSVIDPVTGTLLHSLQIEDPEPLIFQGALGDAALFFAYDRREIVVLNLPDLSVRWRKRDAAADGAFLAGDSVFSVEHISGGGQYAVADGTEIGRKVFFRSGSISTTNADLVAYTEDGKIVNLVDPATGTATLKLDLGYGEDIPNQDVSSRIVREVTFAHDMWFVSHRTGYREGPRFWLAGFDSEGVRVFTRGVPGAGMAVDTTGVWVGGTKAFDVAGHTLREDLHLIAISDLGIDPETIAPHPSGGFWGLRRPAPGDAGELVRVDFGQPFIDLPDGIG